MSRRLPPIAPATRSRASPARAGSPAARSSITRSSIEPTKVTPQALIARRSPGARGLAPSTEPGDYARKSSSAATSRPGAEAT